MREIDLQLFWLNNAVHLKNLYTTDGSQVQVLFPGELNHNQGADFLHAQLIIDGTTWVGSVEIHVNASEWFLHKHHDDVFYRNVVLHVVWKNNLGAFAHCPVLELSRHVTEIPVVEQNSVNVKLEALHSDIDQKIIYFESMGLERLERKSNELLLELKLHKNDIHFLFWKKMIYAFGLPFNGRVFEQIFISLQPIIDHKILFEHNNFRVALLGQANLFKLMSMDEIENYIRLKSILKLSQPHAMLMRFRMRPFNFPEKRLLQFLDLYISRYSLCRDVLETLTLDESVFKEIRTQIGSGLFDRIVINVFAPILLAYSKFNGQMDLRSKAVNWISSINSENNHITRRFHEMPMKNLNALHTQGMIEHCILKHH